MLVEAAELGDLALGILAIDLHGTSIEELLLLGGAGLPVVGFSDGNNKACTAGPAAMLSFLFRLGRVGTGEGLDGGELLHVPGLADAEASVVVLSCLVHAHAPRRSYRDNDQARLLVRLGALGRRRRGGILAILMYAYVRDVRLGQLAVLIELGEAALDDTSLFILESLCARYARRRGMLELRGGVGGGRGLLRVGGVAIAVGRGARHVATLARNGVAYRAKESTAQLVRGLGKWKAACKVICAGAVDVDVQHLEGGWGGTRRARCFAVSQPLRLGVGWSVIVFTTAHVWSAAVV